MLKSMILFSSLLVVLTAFAKERVVSQENLSVSEKAIVRMSIGQNIRPAVRIWKEMGGYPNPVRVECKAELEGPQSRKGKKSSIYDANEVTHIQLLSGQSTDLADTIYICEA